VTPLELLITLTTPESVDAAVVTDEELDDTDWEQVSSLADRHGLVPAMVSSLDRIESVPQAHRDDLQAKSRARTGESLQLTTSLHSIVRHLNDAGIRALPYKGPALSAVIHGDTGARQYVDIDVLVPPGEFERSCRIVREAGYEPFQRLAPLGEVAFENDAGATVDLHCEVLPRYFPGYLSFEALWRHRVQTTIGGEAAPTLNSADRVVVLSVHGSKHCWYKLAWVHDIATLVAHNCVPWETVDKRATATNCRRHVHLGYWLARETFGVDLPSDICVAVDSDPAVSNLGSSVRKGWREGETVPPGDRRQHRYQWRALDNWPARLIYATRVATIPSEGDVESVALPDSLAPLYRVVRPARLAARGGQETLRWFQSRM
jgi:hypothetical protein